MTSKSINLNQVYIQITHSQDYVVLNNEYNEVRIYLGDTKPADETKDFFTVIKSQGFLSAHTNGATLWARANSNSTADIVVAQ